MPRNAFLDRKKRKRPDKLFFTGFSSMAVLDFVGLERSDRYHALAEVMSRR
jgi:hypothetical protein